MLVVTATIKAKPGRADDLEKAFKDILPVFRAEPGIITFKVHRTQEDPDTFFFFEQYRSRADLDAHFTTPHFKTFGRATAEMVTSRPQMTFCQDCKEV